MYTRNTTENADVYLTKPTGTQHIKEPLIHSPLLALKEAHYLRNRAVFQGRGCQHWINSYLLPGMHIAIACDSLQLPQAGSCSLDNGAKKHLKDRKGWMGSSLERAALGNRCSCAHSPGNSPTAPVPPEPGCRGIAGQSRAPAAPVRPTPPVHTHRSGVTHRSVPKPDPALPAPRHTPIHGIDPWDQLVPPAATAEINALMRPW